MLRRVLVSLSPLTLAVACLLAPARAAAQEVADASCPGPNDTFNSSTGPTRFAQTFTAAHSGTLTRAIVRVVKFGTPGDWVLELLGTSAGAPVDGDLATATVADAGVPGGAANLEASFVTPAVVTAGTSYAIAVSRPTSDMMAVGVRSGNPCPGGWFTAGPPPSTFSANLAGGDMVFSTFVTPPAAPAGPTGRRAAALKKCKKRAHKKQWSKKKRRKCRKKAKRLPV